MNSVFPVLALGTASALVYAAAAVAQRSAAVRGGSPGGRGLRRSAVWWVSVLLNALGALLHTAGLRYGSLVAVQMLGVLTLVAAPPLSALVLRRRMTSRHWSGTALTVAGVAGLLALIPSAETSRPLAVGELVGVGVLTAAALGVPAVTTAVARGTTVGCLSYAAAAGVAFGAASAFAQTAVLELTGAGPRMPLVAGVLVAAGVLCLAPAGLVLCQLAYRSGLEAPLATVTLVNPLFAAVLGVVVLGDRYPTSPATVSAGLAAAFAAGRGVFVLARAEAVEAVEAGLGGRPAEVVEVSPGDPAELVGVSLGDPVGTVEVPEGTLSGAVGAAESAGVPAQAGLPPGGRRAEGGGEWGGVPAVPVACGTPEPSAAARRETSHGCPRGAVDAASARSLPAATPGTAGRSALRGRGRATP